MKLELPGAVPEIPVRDLGAAAAVAAEVVGGGEREEGGVDVHRVAGGVRRGLAVVAREPGGQHHRAELGQARQRMALGAGPGIRRKRVDQ